MLLSESNSPINHHQMNINIQFNPNGTALCRWTDAVPLHELGRMEIHRATNIAFNNATHSPGISSRGVVIAARSDQLTIMKPNDTPSWEKALAAIWGGSGT